MGVEIERKFLVTDGDWKTGAGRLIRQAYLCTDENRSVRIRIAGAKATLTIKGRSEGAVRQEFEYPIPIDDGEQLLHLCVGAMVEKIRHMREHNGDVWEIDEYLGSNAGLTVAEIELESVTQPITLPNWIGEEVTSDPRFFASQLALRPFQEWTA